MREVSRAPHPRPFSTTETGTLLGEFPYVRVGDGDRTLAVLPGFGDSMFSGRHPPGTGWMLSAYFYRCLDDHTVYLISRPRGLPEGYTARESADDHARLFAELDGPVDVLGISMGGLIGQELCVHHPELVRRLVTASSACRLGEEGREPVQRMRRYAEEHDWFSVRSELATGLYSDWRAFAYPPFVQTVGRFVLPRPAVPEDVRISLDLILNYDGTAQLGDIDHPTLVIGGTRDPYFTEPVVRATAAGIPDGRLSLIRGGKHGAFHERKFTFDSRTTAFLSGESTASDGTARSMR